MNSRARLVSRRGAALVAGLFLSAAGVRAAESFLDWSTLQAVVASGEPAAVRASSAALLLSGQIGGALPLAVRADLAPGDGSTGRAIVQAEIDGRSLFADPSRQVAELGLFVYALDDADRITASVTQRHRLDLQRWRGQLQEGGLQFLATLSLPAGEYALRVLVRDVELGVFGVATAPLRVPPRTDPIAPLAWLPEQRGDWLVALEARQEDLGMRPLRIDTDLFLPAVLPVWSPGNDSLVVLMTPSGTDAQAIQARLRSTDGSAVAPLSLEDVRSSRRADRAHHLLRLRVPELPSGDYELLLESSGAVLLRRPVVVWSHPDGLPVSWNDLPDDLELALTAPPPEADLLSSATDRRTPVDLTALADGYRATLDALARGEADAAADSLRSLEISARQSGHDTLMWLEKSQRGAASRLASRSPEHLLSLFLLHFDQIAYYRERGAGRLAEHSVRVVRQTGRELQQAANDDESRRTAALATALLGETLRQSSRMRGSEALFREALALDPTVPIALVGLGIAYEQTGRYPDAVEVLSRLVDLDPDDAEARLRLAVNLRRTDRREEALGQLDRLRDARAPDWVLRVAVHEMARHALDAGDASGAIGALRSAVQRWPDDQSLAVSLAYLLDRRGAALQARQIIEALPGTPGSGPSARRRYALSPPSQAAEIRQRLADRAARPASEGTTPSQHSEDGTR